MFNFASKILTPFLNPLTLALVLGVLALLLRRRKSLGFASLAILLVFSNWMAPDALVHSLEDQYPDRGDAVPDAQAIVVLGGTLHSPSGYHHTSGLVDASDRLLEAFRLYRAHRAPLVFCSGGNNPMAGAQGQTPEAIWMAGLLEEWNIPPAAIESEGGSIDTHQNAVLTWRALSPRGIRTILLVTSAFHMPRAAGAFRKAGFNVIAAPADFHTGWGSPSATRWFPSADNLVRSDTAIHEWLGILVYRMRGWL